LEEGEFDPYYFYELIDRDKVDNMVSNPDWKLEVNHKTIY
jgi:hypothetical protein